MPNLEYPKEVKLKDGTKIVLKPFERKDKDALYTFFQRLPESDRLFLKDNVTDPATVERWAVELNYEKVFPLLAWVRDDVVAELRARIEAGEYNPTGSEIAEAMIRRAIADRVR